VFEVLDNTVGAVLVGIFGLGLIFAVTFRPDPLRGYPPALPARLQAIRMPDGAHREVLSIASGGE
jgi:hypothetical protein